MSVISLDEWRKKLADISTSQSQSTQNTAWEQPGQTPTDEEMQGLMAICAVVTMARVKPFTTKSDFARSYATEVAMAAVEGLITTKINETTFGNIWMVTQDGLGYIEEVEDVFSDRH